MKTKEVLAELTRQAKPSSKEGMKRVGIRTDKALGISIPDLRRLAKRIGKDHELAQSLWETEIHDARLLAAMVDDPEKLTKRQFENWAKDFDSWDVCDQCCSNLFDKSPIAYEKAVEWSGRKAEFVKRAGFVLMAALSVHDKSASDTLFADFLPIISREAGDDRNFVKKGVNWALRQIGKRNIHLNKLAMETAENISKQDAKSARWIASDALRELKSEGVQKRLRKRAAI